MEIKNLKRSFFKSLWALLIMGLLFSGCWNYREVNRLTIVTGVAVDKGTSHKYLATLEVVNFKPGKDSEIESKTISGEGDSLLEALRNSYNISGLLGYFNHTRVFIISQEVARERILPIVDLLTRSPRIRVSVAILISKADTAREVLTAQSLNQPIKSFLIGDAFTVQKGAVSKTMEVEVYQAINAMGGQGTALLLPTVGVVENNGQPAIELSGTAVFKQDRLAGFLDGEESKYVLFIKNKVRGGVLLEHMGQKVNQGTVTFKIKSNRTTIKPVFIDGKLRMKIGLKTKVDIWEMDSPENYNSENGRKLLKRQAEQALQENILRVISQVQQNYGADIFGFGGRIYSQMPNRWRKIKPKWEQLFKQLKADVKAEIEIEESGMAIKPLMIGG
ncbi:MAG TPA: Ger(x)C family spore germination protein [Bacillota bacterium]|nr:Ger(x)C family spore germination protein [Bacillota bacterium]